jgi:hypothetical protein
VEGISTHSLKATLLSWASKAQMDINDRRLLGHHVDSNQISPLTYSRDALAGPLEKLWQVILKVRSGQFDPDESRATRTLRAMSMPSVTTANDQTIEVGEDLDTVEATEIPIPPSDDSIPKSSEDQVQLSSEESSGSDSVSDLSDNPDHETEEAMIRPLRLIHENPTPDSNIFIHRESGLGHILRDEDGLKFLCGKLRTPSYRTSSTYTQSVSMCMKCQPIIT